MIERCEAVAHATLFLTQITVDPHHERNAIEDRELLGRKTVPPLTPAEG